MTKIDIESQDVATVHVNDKEYTFTVPVDKDLKKTLKDTGVNISSGSDVVIHEGEFVTNIYILYSSEYVTSSFMKKLQVASCYDNYEITLFEI